jgi:putative endonuclease
MPDTGSSPSSQSPIHQPKLPCPIADRDKAHAMAALFPVVYILASQRNGTLYIGVTSDLVGRISVHKQALLPGFTSRHGVNRLVDFENHGTMLEAIASEKQLKKCARFRKIALIEQFNPTWRDLYFEVSGLVDPDTIERLV